MRRVRVGWMIALAAVFAILWIGCAGGGEDKQAEAQQAAIDALQEMKTALEVKRQELADLKLQEVPEAAETAVEGEAVMTAEELEAQVTALEAAVVDQADEFGRKLVDFINSDPPLIGEEMSATQLAAIRMKSDEDIVLARTYIDEGGDYKRAIRIYEDALSADPDNEKLKAALAEAEELRFMTPERFAGAKKGMSRDEVRAALGQVNYRNVREYPEKDVVAWFFPTAEDGSAAGVFFRKRGEKYEAYQFDYEAVKPKTEGAE